MFQFLKRTAIFFCISTVNRIRLQASHLKYSLSCMHAYICNVAADFKSSMYYFHSSWHHTDFKYLSLEQLYPSIYPLIQPVSHWRVAGGWFLSPAEKQGTSWVYHCPLQQLCSVPCKSIHQPEHILPCCNQKHQVFVMSTNFRVLHVI